MIDPEIGLRQEGDRVTINDESYRHRVYNRNDSKAMPPPYLCVLGHVVEMKVLYSQLLARKRLILVPAFVNH